MNKMELVAAVADMADLSKAQAGAAVDAVFAAIQGALLNAEEVRLVGFGTFCTTRREQAAGRNPRTGDAIVIPAATAVRFKPGKGLKDSLN